MSPAAKILGLTAACVACCALPSLGVVLAAVGLTGLGSAAFGWSVGLGAGALVLAALLFMRRRAASRACAKSAVEPGCGCS